MLGQVLMVKGYYDVMIRKNHSENACGSKISDWAPYLVRRTKNFFVEPNLGTFFRRYCNFATNESLLTQLSHYFGLE